MDLNIILIIFLAFIFVIICLITFGLIELQNLKIELIELHKTIQKE
jgi:hypothetical protein